MLIFLRNKMKAIIIMIAVVFVGSLFYGITATREEWNSKASSKVLAKVNGRPIDPYRYREMINRLARQFGGQIKSQDMAFIQNLALQQTVDFTLLLNQAKKEARISNREVNLAIDNIVKQEKFPSLQEFKTALKGLGFSFSKFQALIKDDMLVQKFIMKLRAGVKVTPDDLREVRASHILVTSEATAQALAAQVKQGRDFALLAKEFSRDPASAGRGGDLGYFGLGMMVPPFAEAAFRLKVGAISEVVKTPFGYHLIKVTDSRLRSFPGATKDVAQAALQEKQGQDYQNLMAELKSKARVEIISPELKALDYRFKGQLPEAVGEYQKAIAREPGNLLLRLALGDTYSALGQTELGILEYEKAVSLSSGNPELYVILAQALQKAGRQPEALEQYKKASLIAGDNKEQHEQLLKIFQELKAGPQIKREQAELIRIAKKEKFEASLKGQ